MERSKEFVVEDFVLEKKPMDGLKTFAEHDEELAASTQLFTSDLQKLIKDYVPNPEFRKDPMVFAQNVRELERIHMSRFEYQDEYYKFMEENGFELPIQAMDRQPSRKKRAPAGVREEKENC